MATWPVQDITRSGVGPIYNPASGSGDKFSPGGHVFSHVKNTNAAALTVTVGTPGKIQELDVADSTGTVPATTGDRMIGPYPADLFAGSDALAAVTWSVTSGVTFAVLRMG